MGKAKVKTTTKGQLIDFGVYDRDTGEEMSVTKLADEFKKSLAGTALKDAKSNKEHLETLLAVVKSAIPIAEAHYKNDARERNCYALTNLVTTASNILSELSSSDDSEIFYQEILKSIVEFQKAILITLASELKDFENKVLVHVDRTKTSTVKTSMEQCMRVVGETMSSEYGTVLTNIEKILGVSSDK